jgi:hypothetical protein
MQIKITILKMFEQESLTPIEALGVVELAKADVLNYVHEKTREEQNKLSADYIN